MTDAPEPAFDSDHGAYLLRRHPEAEEFRRAWDAALDIGLRRIEDVAMDRALNGCEQPVYSYGKLLGQRTVYNDRLLMFMLKNRAPERFGGGGRGRGLGGSAPDAVQLARYKKQWRREWDEERAREAAEAQRDSDEILAGINTKLENMHRNWLRRLSPRVRALYEAYQEAEREEEETGPAEPLPLLPGIYWHRETRAEMEAAEAAEWEEVAP